MTIINAGVLVTDGSTVSIAGDVTGHQIVGRRVEGPVDLRGAHLGQGDIIDQAAAPEVEPEDGAA